MRFLSTIAHGIIDYLIGILLLISPWIFEYYTNGIEGIITIIIGIFSLSLSLMTNYEMSILKIIPMKGHLSIDLIFGISLALSPWIFGFAKLVYLPHLILGLCLIITSLISKTASDSDDFMTKLI